MTIIKQNNVIHFFLLYLGMTNGWQLANWWLSASFEPTQPTYQSLTYQPFPIRCLAKTYIN